MKIKLLIPSIMFCLTTLFADRLVELESQMEQLRIVTPNETCGATTALARPILDPECGCCGANVYVSASILYWHPKISGTEFACGVINFNPTTIVPIKGCLKSIDFRWDWGFKTGIGYNFPYDGWDIFLEYTRFVSRGCQSTCSGTNNSVIALKGLPSIANEETDSSAFLVAKKANSHFCIGLNALQFELGRAFYISEYLALHPKIGVKAAWIGLGQQSRYGTIAGNFVSVKDCSRFSGAGPHFGLGTEWHFCGKFYLYGDICGSLMYGKFNVHHKERFSLTPCSNLIGICQIRHSLISSVGTLLGLGYSTYCSCDDNMHIMLRFGFDAQYIWRINQMLEVKDVTALRFGRISEDLSIHGFTFDIKLDF
ncbi:MAG: Lpg1974 family pore-forming outer membrane protein [Chlamydiales bacterium]